MMTYGTPIHDPERTIRANAERVRMNLMRSVLDRDNFARIVDLAVERATGQGVREYGTTSYDKTIPELTYEAECEIADFLFYGGVIEEHLAS